MKIYFIITIGASNFMIHIAICDNEEKTLNELENRIKEILRDNVSISKHSNPFSLVTYIEDVVNGRIDALYIDVSLDNQNGIRVAESIVGEYPEIKVVFMSDDINNAVDIFRINPVYFLTKPYNVSYIRDSLYKIMNMVNEEKTDSITLGNVNGRNGCANIRTCNIYYIESNKRMVNVHFFDTFGEFYAKLDDVEKMLKANFIRVHQSFIINLDKVKEVRKDKIYMYNGQIIPISRSKLKKVAEKINNYFKFV